MSTQLATAPTAGPAAINPADPAAILAAAQALEGKTPVTPAPTPAPAAEPPKPTPAPEPKPDAQRFAALAKQQKAVTAAQMALKAEQETFAKAKAEYEAFQKLKATASQNPLEYLKAAGLTYDQLTEFVVSDGKIDPAVKIEQLRQENAAAIEKLRQEQAAERQKALKEEQERLQAQNQAEIEAFHDGVRSFIDANAEAYEYIKTFDGQGLVITLIEQNFAKTGKIMSSKEAADLAEAHIEQLWHKGQQLKKYQAKNKPAESKTDPAPGSAPAPRTLSNELAGGTPAAATPSGAVDPMARAMAAMEAAMKK